MGAYFQSTPKGAQPSNTTRAVPGMGMFMASCAASSGAETSRISASTFSGSSRTTSE